MKIKILGPGCYLCIKTEENVRKALEGLGLKADVKHITNPREFARCG